MLKWLTAIMARFFKRRPPIFLLDLLTDDDESED
jgi:hypothetical protein